MYSFIGLGIFINPFINVIIFNTIFEMFVWIALIRCGPTKVFVLIFLIVLNSNVAMEELTIVKVMYVFIGNVEVLYLSTIDMVVGCYLL